jgi:hypothetical protein
MALKERLLGLVNLHNAIQVRSCGRFCLDHAGLG